ncbi:unnamed protein product [Urochloa humidicola]
MGASSTWFFDNARREARQLASWRGSSSVQKHQAVPSAVKDGSIEAHLHHNCNFYHFPIDSLEVLQHASAPPL